MINNIDILWYVEVFNFQRGIHCKSGHSGSQDNVFSFLSEAEGLRSLKVSLSINFIHRLEFDKESSSEVEFVFCEVKDIYVHSIGRKRKSYWIFSFNKYWVLTCNRHRRYKQWTDHIKHNDQKCRLRIYFKIWKEAF